MTKTARFTQADVLRAVNAAKVAGLTVARIDVNDNGVSIVIGDAESKARKNPLDRLHAA